jgi:hypothetical protein
MGLVLVSVIALGALVGIVCVAVRLCNLEHVDLSANILKVITFSCRVKGRPSPRQSRSRTADDR